MRCVATLAPRTCTLAASQITAPAGTEKSTYRSYMI